MCGRYALIELPEAVRSVLGYIEQPNFPPRYNIAPTQPVPVVVRADNGGRRFTLMRWGFLPSWVKDPNDFPLVFNIRSESAAEKPSFRNALKRRRCLMPADGFYEWRKAGKNAQPYLIRRADRRVFAFAALWETFSAADGSEIATAAILTTAAPTPFDAIHPRSPAVRRDGDVAGWLDPETSEAEARACIAPPQSDLFEAIAIGPAINKVANDDASVQTPLDDAAAPEPPPARAPRAKPSRPDDDGQGSLF